jgi:hypothetical protein
MVKLHISRKTQETIEEVVITTTIEAVATKEIMIKATIIHRETMDNKSMTKTEETDTIPSNSMIVIMIRIRAIEEGTSTKNMTTMISMRSMIDTINSMTNTKNMTLVVATSKESVKSPSTKEASHNSSKVTLKNQQLEIMI